jgi:hypothetical protein
MSSGSKVTGQQQAVKPPLCFEDLTSASPLFTASVPLFRVAGPLVFWGTLHHPGPRRLGGGLI